MAKVSVIIATRNNQQTIGKCVESLLNQTAWKNFDNEIIVVNDASTDKTLEALTFFRPHIKLINLSEHVGGAEARNIGIKNATGDYVFIAEADAFYSPTFIEHCLEHLSRNEVGSVIGRGHQWPSKAIFYKYWEEFLKLRSIDYKPFSGWIFRRNDLEKIGLYDTNSPSPDVDLSKKIQALGYEIVYEPKAEWWHQYPDTVKKVFLKGYNRGIFLFLTSRERRGSVKKPVIALTYILLALILALCLSWLFSFLLLVPPLGSLLNSLSKALKKVGKNRQILDYKTFILFSPLVDMIRFCGVLSGYIVGPFYLLFHKKPNY